MLGLRRDIDLRTLGFTGVYFVLVVYGWNTKLSALATVLHVFLTTMFAFIGATNVHNAIHVPIFKEKWRNQLFQIALSLVFGHPTSTYVPGHNLSHHKFTQEREDVMRTNKVRHKWHLLNLLTFYYTVIPDVVKSEIAFAKEMRKRRPKWFWQLMLEIACVFPLTFFLLFLNWYKFLLVWFIPHHFASFGIVTLNLLQHDGCDDNHKYNHSRTFTGPILNWFVCNNGYHGIHHDTPGRHWSMLKEDHDRLIKPHIDPALEQPDMAAYIFRTFIYPGKRIKFTGEPHNPGPAGEDIDWIPRSEKEFQKHESQLGAVVQ